MSVPVRVGMALATALMSMAPVVLGVATAPARAVDVGQSLRAAVPAPTAGTAIVHLSIGGDRATAQTVAPLAGVTFGLYPEQPTAVGPQGDTTQPPTYSCVADADGDCSFSVPVGTGSTAPGARLWAAPTALPSGWTTQPDAGTDFRTDPLYPGRTSTLHALWPLTRTTAAATRGCGHSVGVVTGAQPGSVVADVATLLHGTPSRVAWSGAGGTTGLLPVASEADARALTEHADPGGHRSARTSLDALAAADTPVGTGTHLDLVVVAAAADLVASPAANRLAALGTRVVSAKAASEVSKALRKGCGPSVTVVAPAPLTATPAGGSATATDPVTGAVTLPATNAVALSAAPTSVQCTDLRSGEPVAATLSGTALALAAIPSTPVSCALGLPTDGTAALTVAHQWSLTTAGGTTTYADGRQPADLQAVLSVAGHDQPWGTPRAGLAPSATTTVSDTVTSALPGCASTGATVRAADGTGGTDQPLGATLTPGSWTVTEHVTCRSHLTLQTAVVGGTAQPSAWKLSATGASPGPSGPSGDPGATAEVPSGVAYQLSQSGGDPAYVPVRTDCQITAGGRTAIGYDRSDPSVTVPLGQDVTCTTTDATAELTLGTTVDDASADPASWPLTATPSDPHPDGLTATSVKGGGAVAIRPSLAYAVRQGAGPAGYQLTGLACTIDGAPADAASLSVPPGSAAACTATDAASGWTVTQSSDPASGWSVAPNAVITYTVTASHLSGLATTDVAIDDDLSAILDHGRVIDDAVSVTSGTARVHGSRLTWTLPTLGSTETASFRVQVADHTDGSRLLGVITRATTTEPGGSGDEAVPCAQTSLSHTVTHDSDHSDATRCDAVVHPTLRAGGLDGRRLAWLIGAGLAVSVVGTATAALVSRRRSLRG